MNRVLLVAMGLGLGLAVGATDRPCSPYYRQLFVDPHTETCVVTNYWARPVDLDGDGVADFSHERLRAEHRIVGIGPDPGTYSQDNDIEAFYPEDHVEMYVFSNSYVSVVASRFARLELGQVILPEPRTKPPWIGDWQWGISPPARPTFQAEGLGVVRLWIFEYPCSQQSGGPPVSCRDEMIAGYMAPVNEYGLRTDELTKDGLFGFRIKRADGWHLGWMWLYWEYDPAYSYAPTLEIVDSAVHPEPGTAIAAGMAPRPKLAARRAGEELVLSWATVWKGYTLERSQTLGATVAWTEVPGVVDNIVRVPGPPGTVFFRLRQP